MATQGDKPYQYVNIPLSGRLRTSVDGTELGEGDFQVLKNMRYGKATPKSVAGMTKISNTIIDSIYFKPRAGFHFRKDQPVESHIMVRCYNTGLTTSRLYDLGDV